MAQKSCMILSVWWTPTFSTTVRKSPGVSWAFIFSHFSIISTVWSTPWWASNKQERWRNKITVKEKLENKRRHKPLVSPCILTFLALGFGSLTLDKAWRTIWMNVNFFEKASFRLYHCTPDTAVGQPDEILKDWNAGVCVAFDPLYNLTIFLKGWIFPTLLLIIQSLHSLWISKRLGTGKWKIMSVFFDFDNVLKAGLFCIWKLWHQTVTLIVLQDMG